MGGGGGGVGRAAISKCFQIVNGLKTWGTQGNRPVCVPNPFPAHSFPILDPPAYLSSLIIAANK